MKLIKNNWLLYVIGVIVIIAIVKQCEGEPRTITKTETVIQTVYDTITKVEIQKVPEKVFVERIKTIEGETKTIFVKDSTPTSITANKYNTTLKSNEATADLQITTTGELLDVNGVITFPKVETTTETIKIRDASGLFIYANLPINNLTQPEVGALYQFKNTAFVSGGVQYNSITRQPDFKVGIGIKIW